MIHYHDMIYNKNERRVTGCRISKSEVVTAHAIVVVVVVVDGG